jgi:2-methylfumaryl-CoA isomerase
VEQPGIGTLTVPGSPLSFSAGSRGGLVAPRAGENTDAVLAEVLGLSAAKIGELHDRRIVGGMLG